MSGNDDYTIGKLFGYLYHQNYYKLIGIDLSRQTNTNVPQQISFSEKLGKTTMQQYFLLQKKQHKTILNFSLNSLIVTE